jgi:hypothetical protein
MHALTRSCAFMRSCACRYSTTGAMTGTQAYETLMPKDEFYVGPGDIVTAVMRFGPMQGSYMFHCHNLVHEDEGLMAAVNASAVQVRCTICEYKEEGRMEEVNTRALSEPPRL